MPKKVQSKPTPLSFPGLPKFRTPIPKPVVFKKTRKAK